MRRPVARRAAGAEALRGERLQKVLAELGIASRREAEVWIRSGRLSVNGRPAVLGVRVGPNDQLRLDGRLIRRRGARAAAAAPATVWLCHRSPGEPLLPQSGGTSLSVAERLPRRVGRRFVSVSPLPTVDGGLELLSADGALAARLQRAVRALEVEFAVRVRGELSDEQLQLLGAGRLDSGAQLTVRTLESGGGQGANRWYRMVLLGASGNELRQLFERHGASVARTLRTRLGSLSLPRTLPRGRWQALTAAELSALLGSPASVP